MMNGEQVRALREHGLVQIGGTRQGLGAIDRMGRTMMPQPPLRRGGSGFQTDGSPPQLKDVLASKERRMALNEFETKRLLAAHGFTVTREARAATLAQVVSAANVLAYPVALKGLSDDIAHKTDLGLVALGQANRGITNEAELARAFHELSERIDQLDPRPADMAFLVQEFVADGIEVFAGISRDPDFGLVLAFGIGGTAIEVTRDFALRMLPLREGDAAAMIAEPRGAALLAPMRGGIGADVKEPGADAGSACRFCRAERGRDIGNRSEPYQGAAAGTRVYRCRRPDRRSWAGVVGARHSASKLSVNALVPRSYQ